MRSRRSSAASRRAYTTMLRDVLRALILNLVLGNDRDRLRRFRMGVSVLVAVRSERAE